MRSKLIIVAQFFYCNSAVQIRYHNDNDDDKTMSKKDSGQTVCISKNSNNDNDERNANNKCVAPMTEMIVSLRYDTMW